MQGGMRHEEAARRGREKRRGLSRQTHPPMPRRAFAVPAGDVEVTVRTESQVPAVVIHERLLNHRRALGSPLQVEAAAGIDRTADPREAGDDGVAVRVREVDVQPPTRREVGSERHPEQAALAVFNGGAAQIEKVFGDDAIADDADTAALLDGPFARVDVDAGLRVRDLRAGHREAGSMSPSSSRVSPDGPGEPPVTDRSMPSSTCLPTSSGDGSGIG